MDGVQAISAFCSESVTKAVAQAKYYGTPKAESPVFLNRVRSYRKNSAAKASW
ncbi:hypothetical protein LYNGBM3L_47690 [Moorena producens 3L]|uniref:Uncharacterized protein n=1 Tax=Moorena producens 3L TaxID=489825 RepID=F4XXK8_9CYAN|nr:hypothetical protein LYNGBM3L_47690 [Moorena producens 3L]